MNNIPGCGAGTGWAKQEEGRPIRRTITTIQMKMMVAKVMMVAVKLIKCVWTQDIEFESRVKRFTVLAT